MTRRQQPLFVERQTYRKRRMRDAARFLPVIGLVLVMVPLLWSRGEDTAFRTSSAIEYLFMVWLGLVAAGFLVSLYLRDVPSTEDNPDGAPEQEAP